MNTSEVAIGPWLVRHPRLMIPALKMYGLSRGCSIEMRGDQLCVRKGKRSICLRESQAPYCRDIIEEFDAYFYAVDSASQSRDFSTAADHWLAGWELFAVSLPGLPEPMSTITQYIVLTGMKVEDHVIDLGAYAGTSALAFQEQVGPTGRVIAVEADPENAACARTNFSRYQSLRDRAPELIEAAIWWGSDFVDFTAEGSLGSAVTRVLPRAQGASVSVPTVTLSEVLARTGLERVDIIKADIEGAEFMAFSDADFFAKHHPVLVFEPAGTSVPETQFDSLSGLLRTYGYGAEVFEQTGSRLPLVVCR